MQEMKLRLEDVGGGSRTRLLVVLDGPEYQRQMRLLPLLRKLVERGEIRPHRVALVVPDDRLETYSASARYARGLAEALAPLKARPVGVGASLGGLALLHAHRTHPDLFAGLFLQSGSYFRRRYDRQESGFPRFDRISRFVGRVLQTAERGGPPRVPVTITCGSAEENLDNNRAVAAALTDDGWPLEYVEHPDAHNWISWRDSLHPHLAELLLRAWA